MKADMVDGPFRVRDIFHPDEVRIWHAPDLLRSQREFGYRGISPSALAVLRLLWLAAAEQPFIPGQ
jgi:hypothetical protein